MTPEREASLRGHVCLTWDELGEVWAALDAERAAHADTTALARGLQDMVDGRVESLEDVPAEKSNPPCEHCGGPHPYDMSVPSPLWNRVVRPLKMGDYLCATCIIEAFAGSRESFTAELWSEGFDGLLIEVRVDGKISQAAREATNENNELRAKLSAATARWEKLKTWLREIDNLPRIGGFRDAMLDEMASLEETSA